MQNEIEFFSTNQHTVFKSLANKLVNAYNMQVENKLPLFDNERDFYSDHKTHTLQTLIRKLYHIIFHKGDPLSVKPFLKRILKGEKHHGRPAREYENLKDSYIGKGHFEWDHQAITLDEYSLNAIKIVLSDTKEFASKTQFSYNGIVVLSELYKGGTCFPNTDSEMLHNHFKITVIKGSNKISFDYYDSNNNYVKGITELDETSLINAFDCFISDSILADMDFESFCDELGYNSDSRKHHKIYKECCKSLEKARKIINGDLYDFANEFREAHENII